MNTAKITTRNYRTHLLNEAAKTGDQALANLAKTATAVTLKNLYTSGYKLSADVIEIKLDKVKRVIMAVLQSPNRSVQRANLWFKLQDLKEALENRLIVININARKQAKSVLSAY